MKTKPTFEYPSTFSRTPIMGKRGAITSGHYLATAAGLEQLLNGGNATDAGVATGLALTVLRPDYVNFSGIAPILVYQAKTRKITAVAGVGTWPKRSSFEAMHAAYGTTMSTGVMRTVVPALPDAWLVALARYGRASFEDVAGRALQYAEEGFPMYKTMFDNLRDKKEAIKKFTTTAGVLLPNGEVPQLGEMFIQHDLARVIKKMIVAERRERRKGRLAGLRAARYEFYAGSIAKRIVAYHKERGGYLAADDLADFHSKIEAPVSVKYKDFEVFTCGPWSQGPVMLQALKLLEGDDLASWGLNSARYIHHVTESLKLAFADREAYYGDPNFTDVPIRTLLSPQYNVARRKMISDSAWPGMPPPGTRQKPYHGEMPNVDPLTALDLPRGNAALTGTDHVSVVDEDGNIFSATPSDLSTDTEIVPGLGIAVSSRGAQSRLIPGHPNAMAPGKRPCVTTIPAIVLRKGKPFMTFGTPGGDSQVQAMLQVLLNVLEFRLDPQRATEIARFISFSFPAAFAPHDYQPGVVKIESRVAPEALEDLSRRGHKVQAVGEWFREAGGVCAVVIDPDTGVRWAGADPRRETSAIAW
jgi:gamma-glutamyltranspeptidase/glutathione hydrolase